jgi:hypothetical protein
MRRTAVCVAALLFVLATVAPASAQVTITLGTEAKVTDQSLVRHDGGSDPGIVECNSDASSSAVVPAAGGDSDPNDGGGERQGNEPFVAVDPTNPSQIAVGWNDYCLTDFAAGWEGFAFSTNGGASWTDSLVPGYPQDTSPEGQESPLFGRQAFAGDPIAAFDNAGNLFVGGIAFNRAGAINGDVWVATYLTNPSGALPWDYARTRIVGTGTPSRNFQGVFQDKPMLEVDRTGNPDTDGNVYVCWSRFTGFGQNKIYFSRSTDSGETFSTPMQIHRTNEFISVQGCDIAVEADGDVYLTFRTFTANPQRPEGLAFARSEDGGLSFSRARLIQTITTYFPFDGTRDCGDGLFECPSEFVFARIPLEPRVTSDQTGDLPGVHLVYNAVDPTTITHSDSTYTSAGSPANGEVGQSLVYVISTTNDGQTWTPNPVAVDDQPMGHQFFPDIDAHGGVLGVVWQDSRTDDCYSVQRPMGNTAAATACASNDVVNTFAAFSETGTSFGSSTQLSTIGNQPQYEMFSNRDIPFYGDYNWISIQDVNTTTLFAYAAWTDHRDVVTGTDPREETQDGFDVHQCRVADADGVFGPDLCPNAGGLDQNIYGRGLTITT